MKKILITMTWLFGEDELTYNRLPSCYSQAVERVGAVPLLMPNTDKEEVIDAYVDMADAIIFSGGDDINPRLYGEEISFKVKHISTERDNFEEKLFRKALENKKPMLGICRGMQMINALMGGSLYQDIEKYSQGYINHGIACGLHNIVHQIDIEKNSQLGKIFGEKLGVNSYHHQAVNKVADGFKVTARAGDGIIEGMEYTGDNYIHLVQFHPEVMAQKDERFLQIFRELIK